ncbi:MAG: ABC transporter permease [Anaerolineae bacterium]|nr:ABC transporter permease [Anaerolineae bacterium]
MTAVKPSQEISEVQVRTSRFNRWNSPWLNSRLLIGLFLLSMIVVVGTIGQMTWDTEMAYVASAPLNLPPLGFTNQRGEAGVAEHPLGTEASGRDILAVMVVAAPNTLFVGVLAASIGVVISIVLGFSAGFLGGLPDDIIRLLADTTVTVPSLLILIVIQSIIPDISLTTMALLLALFSWAGATRIIRSQVLTMRESGYVEMALLSGASRFSLMFKEMMPNLLPYIAASFTASVSGAILASVGLEVLGLGPQRVPTLGVTIFNALNRAALLRGMWWWWGFPTLILVLIFIGLLLINLGLDEVANPRLRRARS